MNRLLIFLSFLFVLNSCHQNQTLPGDWEARDSSGSYAEFAVYDNFIQIYTDVAGLIPSWDYQINNDTLQTSIRNYKIDWIKKDSLVLRNSKAIIQLRRIKKGVRLSEVEGQPEDYQPYVDSFYERRDAK